MNYYSKFGFNEFILALGYKGEIIKEYFYKYSRFNSNFTINLKDGSLDYHDNKNLNWKVSFINTGLETARRIKEYQNILKMKKSLCLLMEMDFLILILLN